MPSTESANNSLNEGEKVADLEMGEHPWEAVKNIVPSRLSAFLYPSAPNRLNNSDSELTTAASRLAAAHGDHGNIIARLEAKAVRCADMDNDSQHHYGLVSKSEDGAYVLPQENPPVVAANGASVLSAHDGKEL